MQQFFNQVAQVVAPPADVPVQGKGEGQWRGGEDGSLERRQMTTKLQVLAEPPPLHEEGFPETRVEQLGLVLPTAPSPVGSYRVVTVVGDLVYVSGQIARDEAGNVIAGKLGTSDTTLERGSEAARACGLATLSVLRDTLGSLDRVVRLVKATGLINSTNEFTDHSKAMDGFSKLMIEVFGESGKSARAAYGVTSLPLGSAVEVESVFQVSD